MLMIRTRLWLALQMPLVILLHKHRGEVLVMRTRLWLPLHMPLVGLLQRHRKALQRRGLAHLLTKMLLKNFSFMGKLEMTVAAVTMLQMLLIRPVQARMMHEQ
ncbi:uncharacterized protein LOC120659985 [Panicum virgatum]|uniref:Secreted protein n=1 Tax=Panicum virgatum TaxID=38727 RepID=A0A8T0VGC1_PANVG|nr:uncharacterized protein LOC120659985 [Panicum virgatum]KAG2633545.1 hypothetical protein PVAP13_2NG263700 [Panicum virgatum]